MPTIEAACGFIIIARISSPRRLERIHNKITVSSTIAESEAPSLSEVTITPEISAFQLPKRRGSDFERGPKYQSSAWFPARLIASVAISARSVKFGLSWIGIKARAQTASPPPAPVRIPAAITIAGFDPIFTLASQAPYPD